METHYENFYHPGFLCLKFYRARQRNASLEKEGHKASAKQSQLQPTAQL